jgi:DnaJ-class molecular chaperone
MSQVEQHFQTLGLDRQATLAEVKKKYRILVLKWHPDKNPDQVEEANAQFIAINQSFEFLQRYFDSGPSSGSSNTHASKTDENSSGKRDMNINQAKKIFESQFGGGPRGFSFDQDSFEDQKVYDAQNVYDSMKDVYRSRMQDMDTPGPVIHPLTLTLADIYYNKTVNVTLKRKAENAQTSSITNTYDQTFSFPIRFDMQDGDTIVIPCMGDYDPALKRLADLHFVINIVMPLGFERDGEDLIYNYPLSNPPSWPQQINIPGLIEVAVHHLDEYMTKSLGQVTVRPPQKEYILSQRGMPVRGYGSFPYQIEKKEPIFKLKRRPYRPNISRGDLIVRLVEQTQ